MTGRETRGPGAAPVLTDIPGLPDGYWGSRTRCVGGPDRRRRWGRVLGRRWGHRLAGVLDGVELFLRQGQASGLVTDGGTASLVLAYLQLLFPWGRRRHLMIGRLYLPSTRWGRWGKGLQLRWAARSVYRFMVWARHEIEDYHRAFGIPRAKLVFVPFHHTLDGYRFTERDEGYVFSGGNYDRDYASLIEAVRELDRPVWIASTVHEQFAGLDVPGHVRVEGTSPEGFREALAGCSVVVVAMRPGLLHSGGQQTILNAMMMGKPTIAMGRKWASDYMVDGEEGIIVDYEDVRGLEAALRRLLETPEVARAMGERARRRATGFSNRGTMETIYRLATGEAAEAKA